MEQESEQGYYNSENYEQPMQDLGNPMVGGATVSQDQSFMKQMFNFRKEVVDPLLHSWRGHEYDFEKEQWYEPESGCHPIMNSKGIAWGISLLNSYINGVFTVSNFDEEKMNYVMRTSMKNVIQSLCYRYKEFGLAKTDIMRIFKEIESKVLAILLGARGDGFRQFFSKQYHVSESINNQPMQQQRPGLLSSVAGMFKKNGV